MVENQFDSINIVVCVIDEIYYPLSNKNLEMCVRRHIMNIPRGSYAREINIYIKKKKNKRFVWFGRE